MKKSIVRRISKYISLGTLASILGFVSIDVGGGYIKKWQEEKGIVTRLTNDAHKEESACFVGDDKIAYKRSFLDGRCYFIDKSLFLVGLKNDRVEDIYRGIELPYREILGSLNNIAICSVDDYGIAAGIVGADDFNVIAYSTKSKEVKRIFSEGSFRKPITMLGVSEDEKRIIIGSNDDYYSVPVSVLNTDLEYTQNNLPPKASEKDVKYVKGLYERCRHKNRFPYGRKGNLEIVLRRFQRGIPELFWTDYQWDLALEKVREK